MYRVEHVRIEGFWRKYRAETNLHPYTNIFIGQNGSGKTTFMNLLLAVLKVDLPALAFHDFSTITIRLRDGSSTRTIKAIRQTGNGPYDVVRYSVGSRAWSLPLLPSDISIARAYRTHSHAQQQLGDIKQTIDELLRIGSLSVHRSNEDSAFDDDPVARRRRPVSPIDQRLEQLVQQLTRYQLSLSERSNSVSTDFQHKVLASMLYDKDFDKLDLAEAAGTELKKEKEELTKAYRELGALDSSVTKRINQHISVLTDSIAKLKSMNTVKRGLDIDDIMPLPLLRRTQHVIELSRNAESEKQEIFAPIRGFLSELSSYFSKDKSLSTETSGELSVLKDGARIPIAQLSSGEKQLMILLTETVLQQNQPFVFFADEPELSLHIDWQAKIIRSIRQLNANSQIIVATHSPEIAGAWKEYLIDMEDVVRADS